MDFTTLKSLMIPEGNVIKIVSGSLVLWEKIISRLAYTNLADSSSADWLTDTRLATGYGYGKELVGCNLTNYIPVKTGDVLRVKGLDMCVMLGSQHSTIGIYSSTNKAADSTGRLNDYIGLKVTSITSASSGDGCMDDISINGDIYTYTIALHGGQQVAPSSTAYIRISAPLIYGYTKDDVIITVNEEIKDLASRIPSQYQEVQWIGTDNAGYHRAYLDLGFSFDTKARIEMTHYITSLNAGYVFGASENSGKLRCMITSPNSSNARWLFYGSSSSSYISLDGLIVENAYNYYVYTLEPGLVQGVNNTNGHVTSSANQVSYSMTSNLYLFAQNYNGAPRYAGDVKIVSFKYYDKNDELICDLVPCYRKSDGVIGMYDVAREIFLTNVLAETLDKTFEKGADVRPQIFDYTNVLSNKSTIYKPGLYWSNSGATWKAASANTTVVIRVPNTAYTIRIRNTTSLATNYSNVYIGNHPDSLTGGNLGMAANLFTTDANGDLIYTYDNPAKYQYISIPFACGINPKLDIITVNEEILI